MEILLLGLFSVVRLHSGLSRRGGLDATMIDGTVAGGSWKSECRVVPASERSPLRQPRSILFPSGSS